MRVKRTPIPAEWPNSAPWQALLRGLAVATPRLPPPPNSWMFSALAQKLPLAARHSWICKETVR